MSRVIKLLLLLALFVFGGCVPIATIREKGSIEQKTKNDSTFIEYNFEITPSACAVDTVTLQLFDKDSVLIGEKEIFADLLDTSDIMYFRQFPFQASDTISLDNNKMAASIQFIHHLYARYYRLYEDNKLTHHYYLQTKNNFGMLFNIGIPFYDKSAHPADVRNVEEKARFSFRLGYINRTNKFTFDAQTAFYSGRVSNNDKEYLFEILDCGVKYFAREKFDWTPIPVLRANWSKYKIVYGYNRFREYSLGVGVGLSIEKKFQRFTYTYNTSFDGYHKFDAFFAYTSDYDSKFGSQYTFYHGKNLKMFSFAYTFEFYNKEHFNYENKQNFLHKTLSAGPLFPFYWIAKIVELTQKP